MMLDTSPEVLGEQTCFVNPFVVYEIPPHTEERGRTLKRVGIPAPFKRSSTRHFGSTWSNARSGTPRRASSRDTIFLNQAEIYAYLSGSSSSSGANTPSNSNACATSAWSSDDFDDCLASLGKQKPAEPGFRLPDSPAIREQNVVSFGSAADTTRCLAGVADNPIQSFYELYIPLQHADGSRGLCFKVSSRQPIVLSIPVEVLQHIYQYLQPVDFNSARHTCRSWFKGSLSESLLSTMLQRGGWLNSFKDDATLNHDATHGINFLWTMSKQIARECALGPGWSGNGVSRESIEDARTESHSHYNSNVFNLISSFNFDSLKSDSSSLASLNFTVSTCGHFLMVAQGLSLIIYQINRAQHDSTATDRLCPGSLRLVATVACPQNIICCSMDTSNERYSVAILMHGRLAMVVPIKKYVEVQSLKLLPAGYPKSCLSVINLQQLTDKLLRLASASSSLRNNNMVVENQDLTKVTLDSQPINASKSKEQESVALYYYICSEDDPPRSVAICAHRQCIAFGCTSGIELHWVDALTGRNLNRYFPLTTPSDHLYFLPCRNGIDSATKLRLISSASRSRYHIQSEHAAKNAKSKDVDLSARSRQSNVSGSGPQWIPEATNSVDHLRAVPLSDGSHILYTDPVTNHLFLGSYAPPGDSMKLLRTFCLLGPEGNYTPRVYACGSDLTWGVRVVAVYCLEGEDEQRIWFWSIPRDIFRASQQTSVFSSRLSTSWSSNNLDNTESSGTRSPSSGIHYDNPWIATRPEPVQSGYISIQIEGQEIGRCPDVVDVLIDSSHAMIIWAFSARGSAAAWAIASPANSRVAYRVIVTDGTIREIDDAGDLEMVDVPDIVC